MIHLFVEFGDHHRFDDRQQFSHGKRRDAEGIPECQCRRHVPADHRARQNAELAAKTADQIPKLPALMGQRPVGAARAVRARPFAGFTVSLAPAEGPFGKGAETFFSCSSSKPLET